MFVRRTLAERFWEKVSRGDGCWLWTGFRNPDGYGHLHTKGQGIIRAHRLSWELHEGPIPPGMKVLHRCDNRACVRPDHLFLGTQVENIRDMDRKGRRGNAKLSDAQVAEIRRRRSAGERATEVARAFAISTVTVYDIARGRRRSMSAHSQPAR